MVDAWGWMFFICYKYRVVMVYKNEVVRDGFCGCGDKK